MRFPWLQIDSDVIEAKAGDLAVLLNMSRRETIGLLVDLWAWCLTRSPKDRPPDGIISGTAPVPLVNRAASWTGPEGMLVAGLLEVGLIEVTDGAIRFRGVGRYAATWTKNRRRKESSPEPERNRSGTVGDSSRKTQTQTQTQKEAEAFAGSADASLQAPLFEEPAKAPKSKKPKHEPTGDSRHTPLVDALCAPEFRYAFRGGHDAKAVKDLLRLADATPVTAGDAAPDEVVRRWRICRAWVGYPSSPHLAAFAANWNAYADPQVATNTVNQRAPIRAESQPQYDPNKPAVTVLSGRDAFKEWT